MLAACCAAALSAGSAALALPSAHAAIGSSALLWATIDVCNSAKAPGTIGIRGSMPGIGSRRARMFMRFTLQYRRPSGAWRDVGSTGTTPYIALGSANLAARQAGRDFRIAATNTRTYVLRGVVDFQWRRGGVVLDSASAVTSAGHHASAGADPPGYSAAICVLP